MNKINNDVFVIDFETSGLGYYPEDIPLEVAIYRIDVNFNIKLMLNNLIRWPEKNWGMINNCWWIDQLKKRDREQILKSIRSVDRKASSMKVVWKAIGNILDNNKVLSWNTGYDFSRMMDPIAKRFGEIKYKELLCPMHYSTNICKIENQYGYDDYKWPSLDEAAYYFNIKVDGDPHRAKTDCLAAAKIVVELIKNHDFLRSNRLEKKQ